MTKWEGHGHERCETNVMEWDRRHATMKEEVGSKWNQVQNQIGKPKFGNNRYFKFEVN